MGIFYDEDGLASCARERGRGNRNFFLFSGWMKGGLLACLPRVV